MEEQLNQYINHAFDCEEDGDAEKALQLCYQCLQMFPEHRNEIEYEIAKLKYRNGKAEEALTEFIMLYQRTEEREIHDLIMEAYYGVKQQELQKHFQKNCRLLKNYSYFWGNTDFVGIRYYPILQGESRIWYYDEAESDFKYIKRNRIMMDKPTDAVCIGNDLLWLEDILELERMTRKIEPYMDEENALLLVYQEKTWNLLLQLINLEKIIKFDRILLYSDVKYLENSLVEEGVSFPTMVTGSSSDKIPNALNSLYRKSQQKYAEYRRKTLEYYKGNNKGITKRIKEGKPRILFWTSRFTTILQYHIRDCKDAVEKLGIEAKIAIEKDRLCTGADLISITREIAEFKPDIIFMIDHFRHEYSEVMDGLENLVWICWVQDPLDEVMDKNTPRKLIGRDFVMKHFITWKKFDSLGYDKKYLIDAPVPSSSYIYKPYCLNDGEIEKYSCDICFVCHASDVEEHINEVVQNFQEGVREKIYNIYKGYQNYVFETGNLFHSEKIFAEYLSEGMKQNSIEINQKVVSFLAEDMHEWLNQRVFRQALVDWILDAGFTNIKLWGNGWKTSEKYKKYAMGPAENGETLSKIYQASKIVIGNNIRTTAAARAWETMLSGGFYISNYIPEEDDTVNIRKIIEVGKDVIMFYNREDLIEKLHYYLGHEDERQEMIKRGREAALEKMTYDVLMKRVLKEVAERLEENTNG